ncbi:hypothetical protein EVA_16341 [gut metagenome]|uniref:Uncharacterized protein n=1 Tax=gut metagenome TaxID=749906 RepID=J9G187_9ZZZZ
MLRSIPLKPVDGGIGNVNSRSLDLRLNHSKLPVSLLNKAKSTPTLNCILLSHFNLRLGRRLTSTPALL